MTDLPLANTGTSIIRPESSLEAAADHALNQIDTRQYDAALRTKGIGAERIRYLGFAFEGKKVLIKEDAKAQLETAEEFLVLIRENIQYFV